MFEQKIADVHLTNTIKVAIIAMTKALFFDALSLRNWVSKKLGFVDFVVIFVAIILDYSELLI